VLAVAGTHGKTTTTAMLAWILEAASLGPKAAMDPPVARIAAAARQGNHVLVRSIGGFGGIHDKLLQALASAR
jgi:UDP-N-acetylmuramate: L-alanyl-gamma-D-glutamyl-meso-diaminopimelate ligase